MNNKGIWLGLIFFSALVILGVSTLLIGNIHLFKTTYDLSIIFDSGAGIRRGDDVRVNGVVVGKVARFELISGQGVKVTVELDEPITLYQDYAINIEQYSPVLGGTIISIQTGSDKNPKVDSKITLTGKAKRSSLEELANFASENRLNLNQLIADLGDVAKDIKDAKGSLGKLIKDPALYDEIKATIAQLKSSESAVGKFIYDKDLAKKLSESIDAIHETAMKIKAGEGTVGKLVQNDELYNEAKKAVTGLSQTVGKVATTKAYLGTQYTTFSNSEYGMAKVYVRIEPSEDKYFLVGGSFFSFDTNANVGYDNKQEGDSQTIAKPDLQIGYRVPWILDKRMLVRAGLLEGKPGGGVELNWDDWLFFKYPVLLTVEGRDAYNSVPNEDLDEEINGALVRAYGKVALAQSGFFRNIKLYAGANRITDRPEFMGGIGFEYEEEDIRTLIGLIGLSR